jgi:hypothetical protein
LPLTVLMFFWTLTLAPLTLFWVIVGNVTSTGWE